MGLTVIPRLPTLAASGERCSRPAWINAVDASEMVSIAAGTFWTGTDDGRPEEQPVHAVRLAAYSLGRTAVTWGQFELFCSRTGHALPRTPLFHAGRDHPVVNVSWEDAQAYCRWAELRLPTEREWEFASRGTDGRRYPWGNREPERRHAHFGGDESTGTAPAGELTAGRAPSGCLDMAGNVWEWCADAIAPYASSTRPASAGPCARVLRGGCWESFAADLRTTRRHSAHQTDRHALYGFRVCA